MPGADTLIITMEYAWVTQAAASLLFFARLARTVWDLPLARVTWADSA